MNESQPQGTRERIARRTRIPKVTPTSRNMDKTPRRSANNSPLKTSRGKSSVRRQIKRNKMHPERFVREMLLVNDPKAVVEAVGTIDDPIAVSNAIEKMRGIDESQKDKLDRLNEIVHNVWLGKMIERHVGIAEFNNLDQESVIFEQAKSMASEAKNWGCPFVWIERLKKSNMSVYKIVADKAPSNVYMEHKQLGDRNLLLSDQANIIQIIYGD